MWKLLKKSSIEQYTKNLCSYMYANGGDKIMKIIIKNMLFEIWWNEMNKIDEKKEVYDLVIYSK